MTEYSNNAKEIIKNLDLKAYDAIVTASGDGLIHEVINGLLSRDDALEIDIPIGVIPAGTVNRFEFIIFLKYNINDDRIYRKWKWIKLLSLW